MSDEWHVCTSWEYRHRVVMFVGFEPETTMFISALDAILAKELQKLAGRLNR